MLPSGIFASIALDDLVASLPDRLVYSGPSRLTVEVEPDDLGPDDLAILRLGPWSDKWCLIETVGPEELNSLVIESLVRNEPVSEVLSCHFKPESGEFSYALFREGMLMETFESSGPAIETINFTSELRNVPLQSLLKASDFMAESMNQFGIDPGSIPSIETSKVVIRVQFPAKKTFWQALLGAVSSK